MTPTLRRCTCGQTFEARRRWARWCSPKCRGRAHREAEKTRREEHAGLVAEVECLTRELVRLAAERDVLRAEVQALKGRPSMTTLPAKGLHSTETLPAAPVLIPAPAPAPVAYVERTPSAPAPRRCSYHAAAPEEDNSRCITCENPRINAGAP